jgi:hypothetical protein
MLDWSGYEAMFYGKIDIPDLMFNWLSELFHRFNWEFRSLYQIHIILTALFYALFISRFFKNGYLILFFIIVTNYVAMGNQIRYFLSFSIFLNALYYLYLKRYIIHILLMMLAILSHSTICFLFSVVYLFLIFRKIIVGRMVLACLLINLVSLIFLGILSDYIIKEKMMTYLLPTWTSSIRGGLFNLLPSFICFLGAVDLCRTMTKRGYMQNPLLSFIFTASIASFSFVMLGVWYQVIAHRLVAPMIILWIIFILLSKGYSNSPYIKRKASLYLKCIIIFQILDVWIINPLLAKSKYIEEFTKMIDSFSV